MLLRPREEHASHWGPVHTLAWAWGLREGVSALSVPDVTPGLTEILTFLLLVPEGMNEGTHQDMPRGTQGRAGIKFHEWALQ